MQKNSCSFSRMLTFLGLLLKGVCAFLCLFQEKLKKYFCIPFKCPYFAINVIHFHKKFILGETYIDCIKTTPNPASCSEYTNVATSYRRFDGLCNNLKFPTLGASNTPLRRMICKYFINFRT